MRYDKVMRLVMKSHKLLTNLTIISSSSRGIKKIRLYNESYLSMGSHGPVIQAVLFHCVSSVATDFKCSNGSS